MVLEVEEQQVQEEQKRTASKRKRIGDIKKGSATLDGVVNSSDVNKMGGLDAAYELVDKLSKREPNLTNVLSFEMGLNDSEKHMDFFSSHLKDYVKGQVDRYKRSIYAKAPSDASKDILYKLKDDLKLIKDYSMVNSVLNKAVSSKSSADQRDLIDAVKNVSEKNKKHILNELENKRKLTREGKGRDIMDERISFFSAASEISRGLNEVSKEDFLDARNNPNKEEERINFWKNISKNSELVVQIKKDLEMAGYKSEVVDATIEYMKKGNPNISIEDIYAKGTLDASQEKEIRLPALKMEETVMSGGEISRTAYVKGSPAEEFVKNNKIEGNGYMSNGLKLYELGQMSKNNANNKALEKDNVR